MGTKCLLSLMLAAGLYIAGCSGQRLFCKPLYQEDIPKNFQANPKRWEKLHSEEMPETLKGIQEYLLREIFYIPEKRENWNSAKKTIGKRYGDCEDIAILGSYIAEQRGYEPKILFLIDEINGGHTVTLLEEREGDGIKYGAIEHAGIFYPVHYSIGDLIGEINRSYNTVKYPKHYSYYSILDLNSLGDWRTGDKNLLFSGRDRVLNLIPVKPEDNQKGSGSDGYKVGSIILKK